MKEWLDAASRLVDRRQPVPLQFKTPRSWKKTSMRFWRNRRAAHKLELEPRKGADGRLARAQRRFCCDCARPGSESPSTISGTGYSSPRLSPPFPVDRIKIAQQFMFRSDRRSGDAIIRAAIRAGKRTPSSTSSSKASSAKQLYPVKSCGARGARLLFQTGRAEAMTTLLRKESSLPCFTPLLSNHRG